MLGTSKVRQSKCKRAINLTWREHKQKTVSLFQTSTKKEKRWKERTNEWMKNTIKGEFLIQLVKQFEYIFVSDIVSSKYINR